MSKKITSPKIILFDCFETIVENDLNGWKSLFAEIIKKNHWDLDPLEFWNLWKKYEVNFREIRTNMEKIEESPPFITYEKAWKDCFDIVFRELNVDGNSKLCAELCINNMAKNEPYNDSVEMLNKLSQNHKIGVISNADNNFLYPVLDKLNINFDFTMSSEEAECYKPNPNIFKKFINKNNLNPKDCWYVGDKEFDDVIGSSSLGMQPVLINRSVYNDLRYLDKYIQISDLRQLYEIIKSL